jgi:sortase A
VFQLGKKVWITSIIVVAIIGIFLGLFPTVSENINKGIMENEVEDFDNRVQSVVDDGKSHEDAIKQGDIDTEGYPIDEKGTRISNNPVYHKVDLDKLYKDSVDYNENLKENQFSLLKDETSYAYPCLDLTKYGIYDNSYGYISIPSIDLKLPIYLGANDSTMSYGASHLSYTSLPLGGEDTNCVLSAHTGYIGRVFFDNITLLSEGDEVYLTNYWYTIKYKVIATEIHKPDDSFNIFIEKGKDLVTLLTCISGGKSRYYVICERC